MATTKRRRPRTSRQERSAKVKELAARLAAFRDSTDPAQQAAYEARFDHYSARNAMLIAMQDPAATVVHGFREWLALGRAVRKGEHGIQILAPAGEYSTRPADAAADAPAEVHRFFRVAYVFDIAQTDITQEVAA